MPAMAQDATVSRPLSLVPTFNATATFSEVRNKTGPNQSGELIMQVGPGIHLSSQSGRVQGSLDYSLVGTLYSRRSDQNTFNNNLAAAGRAELVPGWAYMDARAAVTKQAVSAFGQQSAPDSLAYNANQREVLNVLVSPYVRGELAGLADYEARLNASATEIRGSSVGDSKSIGSSITLTSPRRGATFGWGLQGSQDQVSFKGGRTTDNYRGSVQVSYVPDPDLALVLRGGQESTNVGGLQQRTYDNYGGSLRWTPTPRTVLSVSGDRRYFGDSHQVSFEHRMRSSSIRLSSSRDASTGNDSFGTGQPVTYYQLFLRQELQRDPNVDRVFLFNRLLAAGINPFALVGGSFATAAVTLLRRDDMSFTYFNPRSSASVQVFSSSTSGLDNQSPLQLNVGTIRQKGVLATVTHRMTPITSLNAQATIQRTSGLPQQTSDLKSLSVTLNTSLNRYTTASAGVRLGVNSGAFTSNRETSLTASLNMRF